VGPAAAQAPGYDFEIGPSDEIAHMYPLRVDGLVRRLSREDGIIEVLREGP
jgi:hypothetical protein